MKRKFTHIGYLRGCDARTSVGYRKLVQLRETKLYWVTEHGIKYRKDGGWEAGADWPMYKLDLESVTSQDGGE